MKHNILKRSILKSAIFLLFVFCGALLITQSALAQSYEFPNPTGYTDIADLVNDVANWIFWISIPIAVIMIILAGIVMLTAGGNPGRFGKGMTILKYAVIGLAIILIGKGFISLIKSILDLKNG